MDIIGNLDTIIGALTALGGVGVFNLFTRNGRKRDKADSDAKVAEAQRLMIDNYEERIKELHSTVAILNDSEKHYIERITTQNHAIDGKTEQIRNLTDKLYGSESNLNEANKRIIALTEERDFYKMWHCKSKVCAKGNPDPEGRQPPNPKLIGMEFIPPNTAPPAKRQNMLLKTDNDTEKSTRQ